MLSKHLHTAYFSQKYKQTCFCFLANFSKILSYISFYITNILTFNYRILFLIPTKKEYEKCLLTMCDLRVLRHFLISNFIFSREINLQIM